MSSKLEKCEHCGKQAPLVRAIILPGVFGKYDVRIEIENVWNKVKLCEDCFTRVFCKAAKDLWNQENKVEVKEKTNDSTK